MGGEGGKVGRGKGWRGNKEGQTGRGDRRREKGRGWGRGRREKGGMMRVSTREDEG